MPNRKLSRKGRGQVVCPAFLTTGQCNKGHNCKLLHIGEASEATTKKKPVEPTPIDIHVYPGTRRGDTLAEFLFVSVYSQMAEKMGAPKTVKDKDTLAASAVDLTVQFIEGLNGRLAHEILNYTELVHQTQDEATLSTTDNNATVDENTNGNNISDDRLACMICQESYEDGERQLLLPCGHRFHKDCIKEWLWNSSQTCPVCRCDPTQPSQDHADNN